MVINRDDAVVEAMVPPPEVISPRSGGRPWLKQFTATWCVFGWMPRKTLATLVWSA